MGNNTNNTVTPEMLDFYLGVSGFLYPANEYQLDLFNHLYADFDFQLKEAKIDCAAILENRLRSTAVIHLLSNPNTENINQLRMAARKGLQELPQDIIDKMYGKHKKKPDDKE
jgi:hypothetical protein